MLGTLGLIPIVAGGTPVPLSLTNKAAQSIKLTPKPGNAGIVYVGLKGMNTTTGVNVIGVIPKPTSATTGPFEPFEIGLPVIPGGLNLAHIYIDGTTNDGVYAGYTAS